VGYSRRLCEQRDSTKADDAEQRCGTTGDALSDGSS
jgi:hypothetical protein